MRRKRFFVSKLRILLSATAEHQGAEYKNNASQPIRIVGVLQCVHLAYLLLGLKGATTVPVPEQIKLLLLSGSSSYSEEHNLVTPLIDIVMKHINLSNKDNWTLVQWTPTLL